MTTPWKLTGMGRLVDATSNPITLPPLNEGSTQSDWNALEMIVLRVNSHDQLLTALEAVRRDCNLDQWPHVAELVCGALAASQPKP